MASAAGALTGGPAGFGSLVGQVKFATGERNLPFVPTYVVLAAARPL